MDLLPGDVGFSTIGGRTGLLVAIGQAVIGDACRYTHAWVAVGPSTILEAMPAGARLRSVRTELGDGPVYRLDLDAVQRDRLALARRLAGTPYSFADYLAMSLHHVAPDLAITKRVRRYVTDSGHMICSQLVDHALTNAGYHLFDDGRLPQDVTPGDLYYEVSARGLRVA